MKTKRIFLALMLLLAAVPGIVLAQSTIMEDLGYRAAKVAMEQLKFEENDGNILALTDAGYVKVGSQTTEGAINGINELSGCSEGRGNLFRILRAHWMPLWFYFYNKDTGEAVYLEVDGKALNNSREQFNTLSDSEVFCLISTANVDLDYMLNHTDEGNSTFSDAAFCGNEFALVGTSNVWAHNASFDFMQASAFHGHLCPGVTGGYMLANYMEKWLPITNASSESYKVIAVPSWCKDDALQLLWDATVGKMSMYAMALTPAEEDALKEKYNQSEVAGIYVRWNDTSKEGDALVLGFNWSRMYELTGIDDWTGPSWAPMLVMDVRMMDYWDQPEAAVSTIKEVKIDQVTLDQLQNAGMHPLKVVGVM